MSNEEKLEVERGSGNVYRDFARADADVRQTKAILAARIVGVLDDEKLSTRAAQARTGVNQADFSRIRNAKLERFTIDRLMKILNLLGREVDVQVRVQRREEEVAAALS
jgi:predicted XRE-type DNA-binding protein